MSVSMKGSSVWYSSNLPDCCCCVRLLANPAAFVAVGLLAKAGGGAKDAPNAVAGDGADSGTGGRVRNC